MGIPYALIPTLVFWFMILRTWILYGRKIPLVFIALWIAGRLAMNQIAPSALLAFPLYVCLLGIVLVLIDRARSLKSNSFL